MHPYKGRLRSAETPAWDAWLGKAGRGLIRAPYTACHASYVLFLLFDLPEDFDTPCIDVQQMRQHCKVSCHTKELSDSSMYHLLVVRAGAHSKGTLHAEPCFADGGPGLLVEFLGHVKHPALQRVLCTLTDRISGIR